MQNSFHSFAWMCLRKALLVHPPSLPSQNNRIHAKFLSFLHIHYPQKSPNPYPCTILPSPYYTLLRHGHGGHQCENVGDLSQLYQTAKTNAHDQHPPHAHTRTTQAHGTRCWHQHPVAASRGSAHRAQVVVPSALAPHGSGWVLAPAPSRRV